MKIRIANDTIGKGCPTYLIAEAGVNHNGRLALALRLIDVAADAGAQAVKFQTFRAGQVVTAAAGMAEYQKKNLGVSESQFSMINRLELRERDYPALLRRCIRRKITFLSTPHGGLESLRFLARLRLPAFKFGSGDLTNLPLLAEAAKLRKPMIVSTGMATLREVREAVKTIHRTGNRQVVLLHCTSNYPCPPSEVNLAAMLTMERTFRLLVGYSDHTLGLDLPVYAAAAGAAIIEKHFTLDHRLPGPDHRASIEPRALGILVRKLRQLSTFMGSPQKQPTASERIIMPLVRKSLVTLQPIEAGERFTVRNLGIKRPGTGIPPRRYNHILGRRSRHTLAGDVILHSHDINE